MGNNAKNSETFLAEDLTALTSREHEIFNMLLGGSIPKEIAHLLNISYNTVKTHIKKLYHKLGIHNFRDLVVKYSIDTGVDLTSASKSAVFTRWIENKDTLGSYVNITEKIEHIEGQYFSTITIAGKVASLRNTYAGIVAIPDPPSLEAMKKMKRLTLKAVGDGNNYAVTIPTTDTRLKGNYNHYRKLITTKNDEITTADINIDELAQVPYWGTPVPFVTANIEFFQIHAYASNEFKLKFWDIRFFSE